MLLLIIKTILLFLTFSLCYQIINKKEIGKWNTMDLLIGIFGLIYSSQILFDQSRSIFEAIIPILLLITLQKLMEYISRKSPQVGKLLGNVPALIIKDGKLNFEEITRLHCTLDELISKLRAQGINSIEEVGYAIYENNGKLSVFPKGSRYPLPLIVDGIIDIAVLHDLKKDMSWVRNLLVQNQIALDQVFYAFYTKDKTFIIRKGDMA